MESMRQLRARLDESLVAQPLAVRELAQVIFNIPRIMESQAYGLLVRRPQHFIAYLSAQLRLAGHELPGDTAVPSAQTNELRTFLYIHLRRLNALRDPTYAVVLLRPARSALPGQLDDALVARALLDVVNILLRDEPSTSSPSDNYGPNLVFSFARVFLLAIDRSIPEICLLVRTQRLAALAFSWFTISLFKGLPDTGDYSAILSNDGSVPFFRVIVRSLANLIASDRLGGLGDVLRQFRQGPRDSVASAPSLAHPRMAERFPSRHWAQLTLREHDLACELDSWIEARDNSQLWHSIRRHDEAFFLFTRHYLSGHFDISAYRTQNALDLANQLWTFVSSLRDFPIGGLHFLREQEACPLVRAREHNARLFARWQVQNPDRGALRWNMGASRPDIDVQSLVTAELTAEPAAGDPFPGFAAADSSAAASAGQEDEDFDAVCLFCISRLCDPGEAGGEPVFVLPCCGGRVGSVCLEAYKATSAACPFCKQCL